MKTKSYIVRDASGITVKGFHSVQFAKSLAAKIGSKVFKQAPVVSEGVVIRTWIFPVV